MSLLRLSVLFLMLVASVACTPRAAIKVGEIPPPHPPTGEERQRAEQFISQHVDESGFTAMSKGAEFTRVKRVVSRLLKAAGFRDDQFAVHLVDAGDEVNAMAVNSASIVVYRKLLEKVRNDDELAVVLSHEIGHILGRHS